MESKKNKLMIKSTDCYAKHNKTNFNDNPIQFSESDENSFLPLFFLPKEEFFYVVFYQTNINGDAIPIYFPSHIIVRDFENFSEQYMQIAHYKDIFLQLQDYFTQYVMNLLFQEILFALHNCRIYFPNLENRSSIMIIAKINILLFFF